MTTRVFGALVAPITQTPPASMPRTIASCRIAVTGPPLLVTCSANSIRPGPKPASDSTREPLAGTMMPLSPGASTAPSAENSSISTVVSTAPGLARVSSVVRPTAVEPPTSQLSLLGVAQDAAARPR
jgi:hypothetical protein